MSGLPVGRHARLEANVGSVWEARPAICRSMQVGVGTPVGNEPLSRDERSRCGCACLSVSAQSRPSFEQPLVASGIGSRRLGPYRYLAPIAARGPVALTAQLALDRRRRGNCGVVRDASG
jgi:hypothetical protein